MKKFLLVPAFALALGACSDASTALVAPEAPAFSHSSYVAEAQAVDAAGNNNGYVCVKTTVRGKNNVTYQIEDDTDMTCRRGFTLVNYTIAD